MIESFQGKRVTVMGLGRFEGGVGVTRWLAGQGAKLTVTDQDTPEKLQRSLDKIAELGVELHLAGHIESDFTDTDLVIINPAVPPESPFLKAAIAAGVPISTEINLFVERCRATTVGITGSVGKSTTTAMLGHILMRSLTERRVFVGGNLGASLLDQLPNISAKDVVVLELSSFQLERTPQVNWSPNIAVLTNLAPNHLDWHGSDEAYVAAKMNIFRFQDRAKDHAVVIDSPRERGLVEAALGSDGDFWTFGLDDEADAKRPMPVASKVSASASPSMPPVSWPGLKLDVPGRHNRLNAAGALTVAHLLGITPAAAIAALSDFAGLPHRLQRVIVRDGVTYFNDSKSTTPEAAITAINSIEGSLILILGGYDKGSDLTAVAKLAADRARFCVCVGVTGRKLTDAINALGGFAEYFETFESAVRTCRERALPGDVVLLSPACASWGMFEDFRHRGDAFVKLVREGAA